MALAAETEEIATEALGLVKAEYERGQAASGRRRPGASAKAEPRRASTAILQKAFARSRRDSLRPLRRRDDHALLPGAARPGLGVSRRRADTSGPRRRPFPGSPVS